MSSTRIVLHRKKAAEWTAQNPVLDLLEIGIETDSLSPAKYKLGDAVTEWNDLPYLDFSLLLSDGELSSGKFVQYAEIAAGSNGQSSFSFPEANGLFICSFYVEGIKIPKSRLTHSGDNIILTLASDYEAVESGFEIGLFYREYIAAP